MTSPASPMAAIQRALYERLTAEAGSLVTGVYDYVPETADYPYVTVGEAIETPDNAHDRYGWETVATLHVWTRHRGHSQGLAIGARITELLDHQPLTLPGYAHVATRFEFSQTLTDPEPPGDIRHLVLRYRIVTERPA
ncbi:DUF3168 domain-containing protein [Streptomyces sp. NPDC047968]|uniref:DUF3168 domain-containing protein n=1 Tax=unclassified Streptomyces TaxID=2593676 RepID=UPI00343612B8